MTLQAMAVECSIACCEPRQITLSRLLPVASASLGAWLASRSGAATRAAQRRTLAELAVSLLRSGHCEHDAKHQLKALPASTVVLSAWTSKLETAWPPIVPAGRQCVARAEQPDDAQSFSLGEGHCAETHVFLPSMT